ncbi:MAG: hypothetical protein B6I20_03530 [Bacteroidetes bacterium 4572_117]|nr:MAG: hypothetical protein B6I20_03530 [Bacteroidetes bacterium 4572_117]
MKTIVCKKGQFTSIINNFGKGYPQTFNIEISAEQNEEISGTYIEKRYFWIFPQTPIKGKLKAQMQFHRKWINGIYSVDIKPDMDVMVKRG